MGRDRIRSACFLVALAVLTACGSAGQVRPLIVSTFPADGATFSGPVQEVRITYDGPVRILNPFDARLSGDNTGFFAAHVSQREGDPNSIYITAGDGAQFPLEDGLTVVLNEGVVVNTLDHYAEDLARIDFTSGAEPPMLFGRPGMVTLMDPVSFASLGDVPTPGGRDPVGIVSTIHGATQRVWVQLADGGGSGASLAVFEPGDVAMTAIVLPTTGDLVATQTALAVDPTGAYVYAAFRDTAAGTVRIARLNALTAAVAGVLDVTAVSASPGTEPLDLRWAEDESQLVLAASDAVAGTLAFVDRATFTEIDRDDGTPGVQGFALPGGAGRFATAGGRFWVALPGTSDMDVVDADGSVATDAGIVTGTDTAMLGMPDHDFIVQGLAGYAGDTAFQVRSAPLNLYIAVTEDVSDDVGGVDRGATSVVALRFLPGISRFAFLLDSPGGLLLGRYTYIPHILVQEDMDPLTAGVQVLDVEAELSGATIIGRTFGTFAP